ncbi:MAG: hypothetical protein U9Q62_07645 [Campylobacterota bacterium]|nr:hypothetical protein [Campylobacterota bacterium]
MPIELMEQVKEIFGAEERLFDKLNKVGHDYTAIDFDESGLYEEEEERAFRHWKTLTTKLAKALHSGLESQQVTVGKCNDPADYHVTFTITLQDEDASVVAFDVNYANKGEIAIVQV